MKRPTLASALKSSCAKQTSARAVFAFVRQSSARHVKYLKSFHLGFVDSRRPLRAAHKPDNPWTGSSMVEQLTLKQFFPYCKQKTKLKTKGLSSPDFMGLQGASRLNHS